MTPIQEDMYRKRGGIVLCVRLATMMDNVQVWTTPLTFAPYLHAQITHCQHREPRHQSYPEEDLRAEDTDQLSYFAL